MEWNDFANIFDEIDMVPRKVDVQGRQAVSNQVLPIGLERLMAKHPENGDLHDDFNQLMNIGMQYAANDGRPIIQPYDPYAKIPGFLLGTTQRTSPEGIKWLASKPGRLQELIDNATEQWQKDYFLKKVR